MGVKGYLLVGFFLLVGILIGIYSSVRYGIIISVFALGQLAYKKGIEIDIKNKKYRLYTSIGPVYIGDWEPLFGIQYISVFRALLASTPSAIPQDFKHREEVFQVNLITRENTRLKFLQTIHDKEAWEFAKEIAPKLNLKIWDATNKKGKWYESESPLATLSQ